MCAKSLAALGAWDGYTLGRVEAAGATKLTVTLPTADASWWLAKEAPVARLDAVDMPSYLTPVSDAVVAFEDGLPEFILPAPAAGESVDVYVRRWRFSAAEPGRDPTVAEVTTLGYSQRENLEVVVDLTELIPGRDVGHWLLHVTGPIGRGLTAHLTLLPRMTFEVETKPGIAGPHLTPSKVRVTTREGSWILESGGAKGGPGVADWASSGNGRVAKVNRWALLRIEHPGSSFPLAAHATLVEEVLRCHIDRLVRSDPRPEGNLGVGRALGPNGPQVAEDPLDLSHSTILSRLGGPPTGNGACPKQRRYHQPRRGSCCGATALKPCTLFRARRLLRNPHRIGR